ncbi:hypothetical protein P692DRAFT_201875399 [Suillus brevipes Sb2]|nr:hypothetical protein P692DRAFT_201875399 [Suillus brevipes Sb2]
MAGIDFTTLCDKLLSLLLEMLQVAHVGGRPSSLGARLSNGLPSHKRLATTFVLVSSALVWWMACIIAVLDFIFTLADIHPCGVKENDDEGERKSYWLR